MARKTMSRTRRASQQEAALLREAGQFMRVMARLLQSFLHPVDSLWRRLARTEAYTRVDGHDDAGKEPVWDVAGVLESMLEPDIDEMTTYLRAAARRAEAAARRRA